MKLLKTVGVIICVAGLFWTSVSFAEETEKTNHTLDDVVGDGHQDGKEH